MMRTRIPPDDTTGVAQVTTPVAPDETAGCSPNQDRIRRLTGRKHDVLLSSGRRHACTVRQGREEEVAVLDNHRQVLRRQCREVTLDRREPLDHGGLGVEPGIETADQEPALGHTARQWRRVAWYG